MEITANQMETQSIIRPKSKKQFLVSRSDFSGRESKRSNNTLLRLSRWIPIWACVDRRCRTNSLSSSPVWTRMQSKSAIELDIEYYWVQNHGHARGESSGLFVVSSTTWMTWGREGYHGQNRPDYEGGFDFNRWTWKRKKKQWESDMQIVTPSDWLVNCVQESNLMNNYPITVFANPINTNQWKPIEKRTALELLGLPSNKALLLLGTIGGNQDPRKVYNLLKVSWNCI